MFWLFRTSVALGAVLGAVWSQKSCGGAPPARVGVSVSREGVAGSQKGCSPDPDPLYVSAKYLLWYHTPPPPNMFYSRASKK